VYWPPEQQLTCSGTWGCHGNRTIEDPYLSLYQAHHTHNSENDGSTTGRSYRFLYGITGVEHQNWEYDATVDNHNGYKGDFNHNTIDTISYLCGECHGKFHPNPNLGGAKEWFNFTVYEHPRISFSLSTMVSLVEYRATLAGWSPGPYFMLKEKVVDAAVSSCACHVTGHMRALTLMLSGGIMQI
jgi:hypothetical protein